MSLIRCFVGFNRKASFWLEKRFPGFFVKPNYCTSLMKLVHEDISKRKPERILEAGGVDRPLLKRSPHYEFIGLDVEERPDCAHLYDHFILQSIERPLMLQSDMIISLTLLEHVPNNTASIKAIYDGLNVGGGTHHYVPCGLHPYALILRLIGPKLQRRLIPILRPGTERVTGYPAFFDLCTPRKMRRAFCDAGFTDIQIQPFYRANDYFAFFTPAFIIITLFENACRWLNVSSFASGFIISARKIPR